MEQTLSLRDAMLVALAPKPDAATLCRRIARQVEAFPGRWHLCRNRACRRHRRCDSPYLECAAHVLTREQQAAALAQLQQALAGDGK
jgi:hypothetical protein